MKSLIRKRFYPEKAQGMVEFALVLPLLLLLVYGIIEAGRMLFIYSAALTSSREAARYGSAAGDIGGGIAHYADCAGIRAAAKRIGYWAGIQDADITISYDQGPGTGSYASCPLALDQAVQLGDRVQVRVVATYRPLIPLVHFSSFPIQAITRRTIIKDVSIEGTPPAPITPCVSFVLSEQSQEEDAGPMNVTMQLSAATSNTVTVPFEVGGSATLGEDYTISSSPVVFSPGDTLAAIVIDVIADEIYEPEEFVLLVMGTPTNADVCTPDVHMAYILNDDEPPKVYFAASGQIQFEDYDGPIEVQLSSPSYQSVTVFYSLSGTAQGEGVDYTLDASPLVIPAGEISAFINVDVTDDAMDEDNESITVTMGTVENATKEIPDVHTWTIVDNDDPPEVFFTWEEQSADESISTMTVEVQLATASSRDVTVPFSVGGTATRGDDYTIDSTPLVIPAGELTAATEIHVIEDSDDEEPDETIVLTILVPTNAIRGNPYVHTATIASILEEPTVYFSPASQSGDEAVGTMVFRAQLSVAYPLDVTVPYGLGGTATQGVDYTITSSPAIIPAGSAGVDITIQVSPDMLDEFNETIVVTMGTPGNAVKGSPDVHIATILDGNDSPNVFFTLSGQTVSEEVGSLSIIVQLSSLSGKPVTIPFTLSGSAEEGAGKDYTITASPVVIPAGDASIAIPLQVNDDTVIETSEQAILTLGTPTNAVLGSPSIHTVTILDNEPACPAPDSLPYFGSGTNKNKLIWTLQSPDALIPVNLVAVTIRWPTGAAANVTAITFNDPIYTGNALPPYLAVDTPYPLWSGVFDTRQMIFKFDKNPKSVTGDFYQVTATFEGCPPISGIIPSD
jgi:Flp pilus assembly protein TadG